ncbi:MAG: cardiolipin synthase [Bacteroidales bacterium]|nr:cardiolipin synthase [Bacteroidales bacterium]
MILHQGIVSIVFAVLLRLALCFFVLRDKNVQETAMAWVLLMFFLPVTGFILYVVFGKDYRTAKDRDFIHREFRRRLSEEISPEVYSELFPNDVPEGIDNWLKPLVRLNLSTWEGNKVYGGNKLEIIKKGARKKELLSNDFLAARHSIHLEYFRFSNDASGKFIRDILIKKATEGVEVRFILNNLVARNVPGSFWKTMEDAGVKIVRYTSLKQGLRLFLMRLNCQQHRKIVVIDGRVGYMGGMNINDNYFNHWKDTHVRIEGPAVSCLQASFLDTWISCKGDVEKPLSEYFSPAPPCEGGLTVQIVSDEADYAWPSTQMAYEWVLDNAREYVYFQTPYFVPPVSFLTSLKAAALRGVDVRVMLSKKVDTPLLGSFNRGYYAECLEAGVKIIEAGGEFDHSKTMVSDNSVCVIGATNLDVRSFSINSEINAFIYDRETAADFRKDFISRMDGAREWTLELWLRSRPFWNDLKSRFVRLFYREF